MTKQLSCHSQLKVEFLDYIPDLNSIVSDKNNQNDNSMTAIKIELNGFYKATSTETSNSNEKNKGINLSKVIKLLDSLNLMIKTNNSS